MPSSGQKPSKSGDGCAVGCAGFLVGAVVDAGAGLLLPGLYYQLVAPQVLKDGQWGLIYLMKIPLGAIVGALVGGIGGWYLDRKI